MIPKSFSEIAGIFGLKVRTPYIIGVDIGSSTLKVAGLRIAQVSSISFCSIIDISKDNSDGYLIGSIQKVLRDNNVTAKDASLILTDESITIRRAELPRMAQNEIPDALKWQMKDIVHFDIDKAAVDFELLREFQKEDGSKFMEFLVIMVSRETIDRKIRILKESNLNVISINVGPFALENILKIHDGVEPTGNLLVVDFGYAKTEMSVFKNKKLEFVRTIPVGSKDISEAMTGALISDKGKVELSKDEAELVKAQLGISYEDKALEKGVTSIQILSLMRPVLERLSKEIRRSIDYYIQEYGGENIAAVYLVGGGSRLKNLDKFLSEELNIPVKRMELPKSIDASKTNLHADELTSIMLVLGAILGYSKRPNLLPYEYRAEKIEFVEKISLRMIAIIAGVALLVSFLFIKLRVDDYNHRLKTARFQQGILSQIKDLQDRVAERTAFLNQARASEIPTEYILKELSHLIPPNIVFNTFSLDQRNKTMELKGVVYGPRASAEEVLTKFMEALEKSKYFKEAQLGSIQDRTSGREEYATFEITCSLG